MCAMIRLGRIEDLEQIKLLTEACAVALQERGIFQWNEHYPSRERLQEDLERQELFVLEERDTIAGIVVLTSEKDEVYEPIDWLTPDGKNLYVHRLATLPSTWGQGGGRQLMDFAEQNAQSEQMDSIRLDTFSQNKRNQKFYEARGYRRLGEIFFPDKSSFPFFCYEKLLK